MFDGHSALAISTGGLGADVGAGMLEAMAVEAQAAASHSQVACLPTMASTEG
jgi:hypothetical protein